MKRDLEIMPSVMLTQIVTTKITKLGISFFRINRHLSPDPNTVRLKWCRRVSDHSDDVTMFICMPRIYPVWYYEGP